MNYKYKNLNKKKFFSEEIIHFFKRRSYEFFGFFLIVFSIGMVLSLVTHNNQDISWNVAGSQGSLQNIMGFFGSYLSDFFLQSIGCIGYVIPVLFLVWGSRILLFHKLDYLKWRLLALPLMLITLCGGASGFFSSGGVLGSVAQGGFDFFQKWGIPGWILTSVSMATGMALFFCILGVPWQVWEKGFQSFIKAILPLFHQLTLLCRKKDFAEDSEVIDFETPIPEKKSPLFQEEETEARAPAPKTKYQPASSVKKGKPFSPSRPSSKEGYVFPSTDLLQQEVQSNENKMSEETLRENSERLKKILEDFGVQGDVLNVYPGPVVTLYEFKPAPGVKSSRVISLAHDIARSTSSVSTRISVMPGVNALGIEIPNPTKETVYMRSLLEEEAFNKDSFKLPLALGKNISGDPVIADLGRMPHLLIAGTTGSGKSVSINTMILSLLYRLSPEECKFIMIDPKMLELSVYDGIPHLLTPVVTDPHKAVMALKWAVREMESRYQVMSKLSVRNIEGYNEKITQAIEKNETIIQKVQTGFDEETGRPLFEEREMELKKLPFIVIIVDEMADLMLVAGKDIEVTVQRLAQMARAAGIHLVMATQRPSVDVITGTIKANFPTRISFHVTSKIDSRTILGEQGAEQLLGQGDMLYMKPGGKILRVHGPFVGDREVEQIVQFLRTQGEPSYEESIGEEESSGYGGALGDSSSGDELYDQALSIILRERRASTSFIQRHLQIGYNRAARIIEKMESEGVVSKPNHVGKREILLDQ